MKIKYLLWLGLSLSGFDLLVDFNLTNFSQENFDEIMHHSGELVIRLLVIREWLGFVILFLLAITNFNVMVRELEG